LLLTLDAVHQLAAAVWVGGLAQLVLFAWLMRRSGRDDATSITIQRFSRMALVSVATLSIAGIGLTLAYVADPAAFVGTAYGVMIVSKVVLFAAALAFASANFRLVRTWAGHEMAPQAPPVPNDARRL